MNKKNLPFEIAELIFGHIQKKNTTEDESKLQQWLSEDLKNKALFDKINQEEFIKDKLKQYVSYDQHSAWKKISKNIQETGKGRKINLRKLIGYAAAVLIPLTIGSYFLFTGNLFNTEEIISEQTEIIPGTQKAVLIIGNGEKMLLENSADTVLYSDEKINIIITDHTLKYESEYISDSLIQKTVALNTLQTPKGGEYAMVLSDGTKVWLNADSKLIFPTQFTGNTRTVEIEGEAYFEVRKNESKPFIVKTNDTEITVLGTEFNITAYNNENKNLTTLVEGKVKVKNLSTSSIYKSDIELIPGEQAEYNKEKKSFISKKVNTETFTAWRKGLFYFEYETLENLMNRLGRWYDFETKFNSEDLKNYHFTGTIKRYDRFSGILEIISLTTNITFKTEGRKVIVTKKTE